MARLRYAILIVTSFLLTVLAADVLKTNVLDNKIVNGTQAKDGEFPFIVSLRKSARGRHSCGASILNRSWILTAAHCVAGAVISLMSIQYGTNTISSNGSHIARIEKTFVHEEYSPSNRYINDIALLKLTEPMTFDKKIQAVRLPGMLQQTPPGSSAVLAGWGLNMTGGAVQTRLRKGYLRIFSDDECSRLHEVQLAKSTICAGVTKGGKGQCSGDSGGPLIVNRLQVGIVSWSRKPCAIYPYPGVFTEVSYYTDWILKTISADANQANGISL